MNRRSRLLTIDQAARYLNVSKMSLRRWTNSGRLRCHRLGVRGERRFAVEDLEAFLVASSDATERRAIPAFMGEPIAVLHEASTNGGVRHVCSHFDDVAESWRLFLPYFRYHAERGAPIFYIHDSTSREQFCAYVRAAGWDPDDLTARGLLELLHSSQAYLRTGSFSATGMLAFVAEAIESMRARGHRTMLVSGEMTWSLAGAVGSEGMIEYEARLNDLLLNYPDVTIVCHYSVRRFDSQLTLDALRAHPFVQLADGIFPGLYAGSAGATTLKRGSM